MAQAANALSGRLNEVKTNLREIGIIIDNEAAKNAKTRVKTIQICYQDLPPPLCKSSFGSLESFDTTDSKNVIEDSTSDNEAKTEQNRAEDTSDTIDNNNQANGPNDANDYLHTDQAPYSNYPHICYYCDYKTNNVKDYEQHVVLTHDKPAYPSNADIEKLGLKPQGKPWEV